MAPTSHSTPKSARHHIRLTPFNDLSNTPSNFITPSDVGKSSDNLFTSAAHLSTSAALIHRDVTDPSTSDTHSSTGATDPSTSAIHSSNKEPTINTHLSSFKVCDCGFRSFNKARMDRHLRQTKSCALKCSDCSSSLKTIRGFERHICILVNNVHRMELDVDQLVTLAIKMRGKLRIPSSSCDQVFSMLSKVVSNMKPLIDKEKFHLFEDLRLKCCKLNTTYKRDKIMQDAYPHLKPHEVLYQGTKSYVFKLFDIISLMLQIPEFLEYLGEAKNKLSLILYCDEIEVVNPIGKHRKVHKLNMFYIQFNTIPAHLRSKLISIFPIAIGHGKNFRGDAKQAYETILDDFISSCNLLKRGMNFHSLIGDLQLCLKHVLFAGDTLASNHLAGFKASFSPKVFRCCRRCLTINVDLSQIHNEDYCTLRTASQHVQHLSHLRRLTHKRTRTYWSRHYGINFECPLSKISGFNVLTDILYDPMHILLEGIIPLELTLLLHEHINRRSFTLKDLNSFISKFPLSSDDARDAPNIIPDTLEVSNSQTSAQIVILVRIIPFFLGDCIDERDIYYSIFIDLLNILRLILAPAITTVTIDHLKMLIERHNSQFVIHFPNSFVPKHHFLLHLVDQMRLHGPLKNHLCMAFEGKHNTIKSVKWHNFKNLPLSVANYLHCNTISNLIDDSGSIATHPFSTTCMNYKSRVTVGTISYRVNDYVSPTQLNFLRIVELQSQTRATVQLYRIVAYVPRYMAYHIEPTANYSIIQLNSMKLPWTLTKFYIQDDVYVAPRCIASVPNV